MEAANVVNVADHEESESINHKKLLVDLVNPGVDAGVKEEAMNANTDSLKKRNRIHVSNTKKPFFFYLNLAKRFIKQYNDVELCALGMAIPAVVTISEMLKHDGLAIEKKLMISSIRLKDGERLVPKAKIEIVLVKANGVDVTESEKKTSSSEDGTNES